MREKSIGVSCNIEYNILTVFFNLLAYWHVCLLYIIVAEIR